MTIRLHVNATATPRILRNIQQSSKTDKRLAKARGISADTVWSWQKRVQAHDRSLTIQSSERDPEGLAEMKSGVFSETDQELPGTLRLAG